MTKRILTIDNLSGQPRKLPEPMTTRRAVKTLQRRKQFIQERMATYRQSGKFAGGYDKAEWLALRFALDVLDPDKVIRQSIGDGHDEDVDIESGEPKEDSASA